MQDGLVGDGDIALAIHLRGIHCSKGPPSGGRLVRDVAVLCERDALVDDDVVIDLESVRAVAVAVAVCHAIRHPLQPGEVGIL